MIKRLIRPGLFGLLLGVSGQVFGHYPILDCNVSGADGSRQVICEASFSDRSKAPDVIMEVFSEDDEMIFSGRTDAASNYRFDLPDGVFFIIMDAGPGHVLEISSDEVEGI
ncbi:MAG: hypothetical protein AAF353_13450 [Pseudomonadota bacterium]